MVMTYRPGWAWRERGWASILAAIHARASAKAASPAPEGEAAWAHAAFTPKERAREKPSARKLDEVCVVVMRTPYRDGLGRAHGQEIERLAGPGSVVLMERACGRVCGRPGCPVMPRR